MMTKFRHKAIAMTLAMMMSASPVWGAAFAADDFAAEQPEKPVATSYEDNEKIEEYNKKVDEYNKTAEEYNKSVDSEYEAAVEETNKQNAEIDQHNQAEIERVETAKANNAKAEAEAQAANEQIDQENAEEEARVIKHNEDEDAKVEASQAAKEAAEARNEEVAAHNEAVAKYAEDYPKYKEALDKYEADKKMEAKILAAGYASVEAYNDRINKVYNEPAAKAKEQNAVTKIESVSQTYSVEEAAEKSGVPVQVNVKHVFEGTDVSYEDSFTIDEKDIITLKPIAALGSATAPGYAQFYYNTDEAHSVGYWCESWSQMETTANYYEYGWDCGDTHTISYSEGKSHANDEEVIDLTYYYFWIPLRTAKTYDTPVAPEELVDPGAAQEFEDVPEIYSPQYEEFVKKDYVKAETEEIAEASILEKIAAPIKKAYIALLSHMDLFDVPEPVIEEPAPEIEEPAAEIEEPVAEIETPAEEVPEEAIDEPETPEEIAAPIEEPVEEIAEPEVPAEEPIEEAAPIEVPKEEVTEEPTPAEISEEVIEDPAPAEIPEEEVIEEVIPVEEATPEAPAVAIITEIPESVVSQAEPEDIEAPEDIDVPEAPAATVTQRWETPASTQNAARQAATSIADEEVPLTAETGSVSPVAIADEQTPLASISSWALLNLIMAIVTGIISVILMAGYFNKSEDDEENEDDANKRNLLSRFISLIPAVSALVIFLMTEDMRNPMVLTDGWTIPMAVILLIQGIVIFNVKRAEGESSDEEMTEAVNA